MREDLKVLMNLLCALPTLTYSFSIATLKGRFKTEQHKTKHFFYREAKEGPEVLVPKEFRQVFESRLSLVQSVFFLLLFVFSRRSYHENHQPGTEVPGMIGHDSCLLVASDWENGTHL